jgi:hypothetical protein
MADAREIYRSWLRELKEDYREFGQFRADELDSYTAVDFHYSQFLTYLATLLEREEPAIPLKYMSLAEKEVAKIKEKLVKKFDLFQTEKDEARYEADTPFDYTTGQEEDFDQSKATRRKQLFPDLASLVDYISGVPYPAGIQIVRDENRKVIGYYVWVSK